MTDRVQLSVSTSDLIMLMQGVMIMRGLVGDERAAETSRTLIDHAALLEGGRQLAAQEHCRHLVDRLYAVMAEHHIVGRSE